MNAQLERAALDLAAARGITIDEAKRIIERAMRSMIETTEPERTIEIEDE